MSGNSLLLEPQATPQTQVPTIYSFIDYLLSSYYEPDPALSTGTTTVNKTHRNPFPEDKRLS